MKYSGTLSVTPHQVGAEVYVLINNRPAKVTVKATESNVYKDADNNTVEDILYSFTEFPNSQYPSAEVFASSGDIKTEFENDVDDLG